MASGIRRLVPSFIRRSYALKFAIVLLLLGLSVGTVGLVETTMITDSVEETVLEDQQETAVQEAAALDRWDERNEHLLQSAAQSPVFIDDSDDEAIEAYLQDAYSGLPEDTRENILYVDTETGDVLAGTGSDVTTLEEAAFPDVDELDGDLSQHVVQRTDPYGMPDETGIAFEERPAVSYYLSVGDDDDRALVMTFDLADRSLEMPSATQSSTLVTVVDTEDRIVSDDSHLGYDDFQTGATFGEEYPDATLLSEARGDTPGAVTVDHEPAELLQDAPYEFDAEEYVVGYHTTDDDWLVLVHTTEQQAFGLVNSISQLGMALTVAAVLLIGVFGAIIGRNTATSIDRLTDKANRMEEGDLDVEFDSKRIDNIGRLSGAFDSMRGELKATIAEAEDARADAETERQRVQEINDHLETKADEYSAVMQAAADGDLTARMDPDSDNEAMNEIGAEFNDMLTDLEMTIAELNQFATDVATASEQVTASSEEVRSASQEVSESVQQISDGADRQHQALQSVDSEMNTLSTTTEEIAASSNEVSTVAERTAQASHDGQTAAQEAIDASDALAAEHRELVDEFDELSSQVDQITTLTDTITQIAEQTNMLALNANIEASRSADGDSDGFGAVAAEVKELSQDVKDAAEQINDRLKAVEAQTEQSSETVDRTSEEVERVNTLVSDAVEALEEIAEYAEATNDGVQEISAATEEQAASTQEVVAMVDEVGTISEETTAEAETVAAAAEEQTSALTEVSGSADELTQQAVQLSEALDRFETETETAGEYTDADDDVLESTLDVDPEAGVDATSQWETDAEDADDGEAFEFDETVADADADADGDDDAETGAGITESDADTVDSDPLAPGGAEPDDE
ncbi:methyl-accepting chemotaxis protein [Natronolimnobius sp. AArcel1]|uniref:methyl-accepting chemotaxis protein n=1 Tax=Natronolimnobius sp. AArcel1 TaxID=1679093 RepID=UPI0013E9D775|nr:methyl-accepting chemotaxis protein [Natronolimnobius sp. AArcel1]NGM69161.1 methyl-accepting chemotaxis protein [Natronolimnobius sp. AArcel1]